MVTLEFKFRVGGVLTNATSVALSNPTAAFGVRRKDTGAVVVAAGTAMANASTGVYRYSFTPPAAGLTYEWVARVVYGGATYHFEREFVDAAPAVSGGYLTASSSATLRATLPGLARLNALDDATIDAQLLLASIDVDAAGPWQGRPYDPTGAITATRQTLEFPRVAYDSGGRASMTLGAYAMGSDPVIWDLDPVTNAAVVPEAVKIAVLYQAADQLDADRQALLQKIADGLASKSVGPLSESYRAAAVAGGNGFDRLCQRAQGVMRKYRLKSGSLL